MSRTQYCTSRQIEQEMMQQQDIPVQRRLVERNLPFGQSRNKVHVQNIYGQNINNKPIRRLLWFDWYHVLLRWKLYISLSGLLILWTLKLLLFAGLYYAADRVNLEVNCGLGYDGRSISWRASFAFSLQTCTTVGYTLPSGSNSFFNNCPEIQIVIFSQMVTSIIFNAFLFAFCYVRLAKCDARALQVLFSSKAIISVHTINDPYQQPRNQKQVRFQVRIFDLSSGHSPVVEAHVRVYAVLKNNRNDHQNDNKLRQLRLIQPNDTMGGMLFLSIPSVAVHSVDMYSVLHPPMDSEQVQVQLQSTASSSSSSSLNQNRPYPSTPYDCSNVDDVKPDTDTIPYPVLTTTNGGFGMRSADSRTGSREEVLCPICGESYGTVERWIRHVRYNQFIETHDKWKTTLGQDRKAAHSTLTDDMIDQLQKATQPCTDIEVLKQHFQQTISEIIVLVEGIEPNVSGSFCGLQSYTFEDIVFTDTACFRPCIVKHSSLLPKQSNALNAADTLQIDLDAFHGIDYFDHLQENNDDNDGTNTSNYYIEGTTVLNDSRHSYKTNANNSNKSINNTTKSDKIHQQQKQKQDESVHDAFDEDIKQHQNKQKQYENARLNRPHRRAAKQQSMRFHDSFLQPFIHGAETSSKK